MDFSWRKIAALLCAAVLLQGCATSSPLTNARNQFFSGQPEAALETLGTESVRKRDRLLAHLDTGLIAHTAEQYEDSIDAFKAARTLLESVDYVSVREQSASLVSNDWATTYKGEYSERLLIHTYQMMNFLILNNPESAAVEARQALSVLNQFSSPLKNDWFTRSLIAMSFEAAGKPDSAHIEYKKLIDDMGFDGGIARAALRNARKLGREQDATAFATKLDDSNTNADNTGELVLFLQAGSIPHKLPGDLFLDADLRASFPLYPDIQRPHLQILADVNGLPVKRIDAVKTQTVDIARAALAARGNKVAAKQLVRLAAKKNLAQAARRENEGLGALLSIAFVVLEQADTRSWETLPAHLNLVQIPLPAGRQEISLQVRDGTRFHNITLSNIDIAPDKRTYRAIRIGAGAPQLADSTILPAANLPDTNEQISTSNNAAANDSL